MFIDNIAEKENRDANYFNFGKRLCVTGHEYRKTDYGAPLRWVALVKTVLCQKGGTIPLSHMTQLELKFSDC